MCQLPEFNLDKVCARGMYLGKWDGADPGPAQEAGWLSVVSVYDSMVKVRKLFG